MMENPHVESEIGALREVIVHRPGSEIRRLTPSNHDELLFDDLVDPVRITEEHDHFVEVLQAEGVKVYDLRTLLAETLHNREAREAVLTRTINERRLGAVLTDAMHNVANDLSPEALADVCIEGVTVEEWKTFSPVRSLVTRTLADEDFLLRPLPNHLFARDASAWLYHGVAVNSMSRLARERESLHYSSIYRWHPRFISSEFDTWSWGTSGAIRSAEGGDALVIGDGIVLFGISERTTPQGVERLAIKMFNSGQAHTVVAIELPHSREFMHLDTVLTQVDHNAFLLYPSIGDVNVMLLTQEGGQPVIEKCGADLKGTLERVMGCSLRFIFPDAPAADVAREQWNDGFNAFALSPGKIIAYDRSPLTNAALRDANIEVLEVGGSELGRGRGGPRCMTCPILRDAVAE